MTHAVIVSTARTPLAKSWKGSFNMTCLLYTSDAADD